MNSLNREKVELQREETLIFLYSDDPNYTGRLTIDRDGGNRSSDRHSNEKELMHDGKGKTRAEMGEEVPQ
jgi:hypothetical protein